MNGGEAAQQFPGGFQPEQSWDWGNEAGVSRSHNMSQPSCDAIAIAMLSSQLKNAGHAEREPSRGCLGGMLPRQADNLPKSSKTW